MTIPLNDLKRRYQSIKPALDEAVARVLASGWYILGPEVAAFESEFAAYCQVEYCVGVANGTDALEIALRALKIVPGDEVVSAANAGMYSTTAIRAAGARPVYAEIDPDTDILDPKALSAAITQRTRAVILTHLYGRMAHLEKTKSITSRHGIPLIEDCAQSHGAQYDGKRAGSWGDIACFSFYPTKNLGALGDGGAVVTSDIQLAERARYLRQYGWVEKYHAQHPAGRNSRLDEIQAAVLRVQLNHLDQWNLKRREIAGQFGRILKDVDIRLPVASREGEMVYHLYVIHAPHRESLRAALVRNGVGCDVHYPIPDHLQPACQDLGYQRGDLLQTEIAASEVLSIPCFPEMEQDEIERVAETIKVSMR